MTQTHTRTHRVVTETTGRRRMIGGEVDDNIQEIAFCLDCNREVTDAEIEAAQAAEPMTFGFDEQGHLVEIMSQEQYDNWPTREIETDPANWPDVTPTYPAEMFQPCPLTNLCPRAYQTIRCTRGIDPKGL